MIPRNFVFLFLFAVSLFSGFDRANAESSLLSPQENLWLQSRNNTIVVYPEKTNPPFSYQTPAGIIEGLSIDYIELIAEKLGISIQYLTPRSLSQILDDTKEGKGDVLLTLAPNPEYEKSYIFTESYVEVPFTIVVRKDVPARSTLTPVDFVGKRLAITKGSVASGYLRQNYPRVILEDVTDDEASLQQVVLGQVDGAVMDVASLSYLLSKQVLSSVKTVGNVGYEYKPAFAMTKDKEILQSILEKGFSQISSAERKELAEKWVSLPNTELESKTFVERLQSGKGILTLYVLVILVLVGILVMLLRKRALPARKYVTPSVTETLHQELEELEVANQTLQKEIEDVKHLEEDIEEKLRHQNE